ncbi:MAG: hypothetical protein ACI9G1_006001, partial [Pirellulaceae bacterium]
ALSSDKKELVAELDRLRKLIEQKKKEKTTAGANESDSSETTSDHSSEKQRRKRDLSRRRCRDRRSFKKLTIHEEILCPIDPSSTLPPDAMRMDDEFVVVQDIKVEPRNIRFRQHVYFSPSKNQYFRGPLPSGYDAGDFGPDLRALIVSLKYCGNMSEPKIREFLENFDVQVSSGSVSNILTKSADLFAEEFDSIVRAGLESTSYQQTDDTSARVDGQFWHTHILCNPFYAAYFTRPHKDRLTVLEILQNTSDLQFRMGSEMLELLRSEFTVPQKWEAAIEAVGEQQFDRSSLKSLLDAWFDDGNVQLRTSIEHASAIVYYRHQTSLPRVKTIVCDDAGQFKLITDNLALCWIHAGRHYAKLSPVVPRHVNLLDVFIERYWDFYQQLQDYRAGPSESHACELQIEFDNLFATRTGYTALDDRIAKTAAKKEQLLTVLSEPSVPLHNNASELQARVSARRRDVSLHSRSERGARAMDVFTTLVQTCKKLSISGYAYLRDRFSRRYEMPSLAETIHLTAKDALLAF